MSQRSTGLLLPSPDTVLALGFVAASAVESAWHHEDRLWLTVPAALLMLVLALRRSRPLAALTMFTVVTCAAIVVQAVLPAAAEDSGAFVAIFALVVLTYSLGAHADHRGLWLGCWQPVLIVVLEDLTHPSENSLASAVFFFSVFVVAAPTAAGRLVRSRRRLVGELRDREAQLTDAHHDRLVAARAEESLQLSRALDATLSTGLQRLEALALRADPAEARTVESEARSLLARTREVVVRLNQPVSPTAEGPAEQPVRSVRPEVLLAAIAVVWALVTLTSRLMVPLGGGLVAAAIAVVLSFAVATVPGPRAAPLGLAACVAGVVAAFGPADAAGAVTFAVLAWLAGRLAASQTRLAARLRRTTAELAALRHDEVERTRLEERVRVAHDVHDSIGHALTAITLQAEAARRFADAYPERAQEVLSGISRVVSAARDELSSGFAGGRDLGDLIDSARAAGLRLDVHLDEPALPVPLRTIVYRVLQEALTNALRHAPGAFGEVRLCASDGNVALLVRNGAGNRPGEPGSAVGLQGMRRRVEAVGGQLVWQRHPDGGFELRAKFPEVTVG